MTFVTRLSSGFQSLLSKAGTQIKIDYYDIVFDEVYDEADDEKISGTLWTSGIILPMNTKQGSEDSVLVESGKLQEKDKRLYVNGSTAFSGDSQIVKIQIGSPTGETYSTIPLGAIKYEALGQDVYKRQYLRLING